MASTRPCAHCGETIHWQDTADPYRLQAHVRLWLVDASFERVGGYFCDPECALAFMAECHDEYPWAACDFFALDE